MGGLGIGGRILKLMSGTISQIYMKFGVESTVTSKSRHTYTSLYGYDPGKNNRYVQGFIVSIYRVIFCLHKIGLVYSKVVKTRNSVHCQKKSGNFQLF